MRYVGDLITVVRRQTFNLGETSTAGLTDDHFLEYLNDAQSRLDSLIAKSWAEARTAEVEVDLVAWQRAYSIPADAIIKNRVLKVEYSYNGQSQYYYPLTPTISRGLNSSRVNGVQAYVVINGQVLVTPVPNSTQGKLRISYYKGLDRLDLRRGTISAVTASATQVTALTINAATDDATALSAGNTLCVNDRDGNVTMYNIRYDSYDTGTGVVTLTGGAFTFATGETIAVGSYVTVGAYTTTTSKLPDVAERYLTKYGVREIEAVEDSTLDVTRFDNILSPMEQDIVALYEPMTGDIEMIPAYVI